MVAKAAVTRQWNVPGNSPDLHAKAVAEAGVGHLPAGERRTAGAVEAGSIQRTAVPRVEEEAARHPATSTKAVVEAAGAAENLKKMTWIFKRRTMSPFGQDPVAKAR